MTEFCSRASLASHEAMAGTAVRGAAYVFLPVAKRFWHGGELNPSWASPTEIEAIRAGRAKGVVTRLYNPPPVDDAPILAYTAPGQARPPELQDHLALFSARWPVESQPQRRRLAVCTHGTRDRCCAKWGFAVWRAVQQLQAQGASAFEAIECSHLGGDRFAATGVVFPSGSMYAHLDSIDLAALLAAEASGRIAPETYRGGVFEGALAQVVRAGLAREGLFNDLSVGLQAERDAARRELVHAQAGEARWTVELAEREVRFFGDCAHLEQHRASVGRRAVFIAAWSI